MKTIAQAVKDEDYYRADITVEEARAYFDGKGLPDELEMALDEAQGLVHTDSVSEAFVVIVISKQ